MLARVIAGLFAITTAGACYKGNSPPASGDVIVLTGDQKADAAQILDAENQAKRLVRTDGCNSISECRSVEVGAKGCGGPRYYLVYCARTTDTTALFRKLAEIARADHEYNTKYHILSTCEFRLPPTVALSAGACRAQ